MTARATPPRRIGASALRAAAWLAACGFAMSAGAQDRSPLTTGADVIAAPSLGRVLLVFVVVAALGVVAITALKRLLPRFAPALAPSPTVQVLERATLAPGLRVHVLQLDGEKVLLAEKRDAVALVALGKSTAKSEPTA